jgi:nitrite reductase/ring-hydroxylating ferredoxin subunit
MMGPDLELGGEQMPEFETVGRAEDVAEGQVRAFDVEGAPVAVARVGGRAYAFSDICTHRQCNLSASELDGTTIECECHGSVFDITTGAVLNGPATEPIATYEVREDGGELRVGI